MAELNRSPFDLLEAESELVAGTRWSSGRDEVCHVLHRRICQYPVHLDLVFGPVPGWLQFFGLEKVAPVLAPFIVFGKGSGGLFIMLWTRGTFPRVALTTCQHWPGSPGSISLVNLVLAALLVKLSANPGPGRHFAAGNLITVAVTFLILSLVEAPAKVR